MKKEVLTLMIIVVIYSVITISALIFLSSSSKPLHPKIQNISLPFDQQQISMNTSQSPSIASPPEPSPIPEPFPSPNQPSSENPSLPTSTASHPSEDSISSTSLPIREEVPYKRIPKSSCEIQDFSLTSSEYKFIFNFQEYSNCKTSENDEILMENNTIIARCFNGNPLFSVDPGNPQRLGGKFKEEVEWTTTAKLGPRSEYAFIKCKETVYSIFFLRMNQTAANRAKKIKDLKAKDANPMNVLVLVLDSVSRFTTYKFLPKLTEFLQNRKKYKYEDYSVYEFLRLGIPAVFTLPNMIQVLYGENIETAKKSIKIERPDILADSPEHLEYQKKKSLWNYYMNLGYVSLFLKDTVHDYLNKFLGREITADHVFENFWRAAWNVYGFNDFSNRQRCYGRQNSHNLTFGYAFEFFEKYQNTNKFAYVHLDAGHETTGNIQTVDEDLTRFFEGLTKLFNRKKESFAVYFMSDHGYKFEKLAFDERGFIERNSPFAYLMISRDVEEKMNARGNLIHNSQMLTGRLDANLMLKYLAHAPYKLPDEFEITQEKHDYPISNVANLLTERVSSHRTCKDLEIPEVFCICNWYKPIDTSKNEEMRKIKEFYPLVMEYFENNSRKSVCKSLHSIEFIKGQMLKASDLENGDITFYDVELLLNNRAKLNAKFSSCIEKTIKQGMVKLDKRENPYSRTRIGDDKIFIQLTKLELKKICPNFDCIC
jgi:hypothetical protein